ncbi:MAG TPA: discoidin domain-containing protein, partial [Cytophagaceae bacterium]
ATFWHNNWGANAPLPHTLVFNLGANYDLGGLDMLNRQSNSNGYPKEVEISTSVDGTNWSTPVTWTFTNTAGWQTAYFSGQGVRYLRLKVISTISGANTCSMAEIKLRGCDKKVLSAAITSPLSGASFYTNENVIISANAIPSDGKSITKVEFYVDNVLKGTVTTAPYQYNAGMLTAGSHTLKVIAYETGGTTATSALVPITIVPVVNYDAAISSLQMVALPTCGSSVNASYILTNKGVVTLTSIRSEIYLNNQLVETRTHSVNLAKNQTTAIALNSIAVSSSGNNVLKVKVIDPNNQTDENTADNEQTVNFTIGVGEEHQFYIATRSLNPSITWQIKSGTTVVVNSSNVTSTTSGNNTVQNFCLVPGCYDLVVTNAFQSGGCTAPAWSSSTIYLGDAGLGNGKGEIVSYNGRQYRAQWWTQNNTPGTNSVWLDLGVCNTTYPTDVYGLKNITTPATHVEVQQQNYSSPKSNNFCFGTTATADFSASTTTVLNCQNVTFTANTTGTVNSWLWNFGAGANPATATTAGPHTVTYTTTGPKTISLTINGNTTETKTNYVNVSQNTAIVPAITIEASSTTICAGTTVNFTIASQQYQGTAPGYSWRVNGTQVGTGTTFSSSTLSNNDKVTVVMTSNEPCATTTTATSNQITVTVNPSVTPTISIVASETTICNGTAVTFTATPSTAGTIQWKLNGNNVGTGGTTYTTSSLSNNDKVTAVLTASGSCLSTTTATSNQITMSVNSSVTPTISIVASETTICNGTAVTFTATSSTAGTIQWKLNGNNVGTGGTTYTTSSLSNNDKVTAVLTASGSCLSTTTATSNQITMSVNSSITPTISIVASETTICNGTAVTFTATPSTAGSIQWKLNGNNVGTGGTTYTTSSLSNNDKVTAVLTASGSCLSTTTATSNQVTVIVNPSVTPTISITSSATTITQGTTVTFTASATSGTIQWKLNGNNVGSGATTYAISTLQNGDKVSAVLVSNAPCANPTSVSSNEITITVTPVGNTVSCSNVSSWNANAIYVQGDQCERNGIKYEAKWWTRGNDPVNYSGQWDVWKKLGDCTPGTYGQIAPTLVMNPSGDTTVAQNTTINIALKSVEAFTNVSYYLYSGEVLIATLNGSGLNFNAGWKAMQAGDFWLQVVATDNNNTKVYSNAILLAVQQVTEVTSNLTIGTIEVIPNPNNGTFSLSTKEVTNLENAKMEIIDMYGHTVYTGKISSSIEIIEVGKPNAGMYQLKVLKEDKVYISKFVIQQ